MKIVFYLSDHGFGHAVRNIPIIESLLKHNCEVIVKTGSAQGEFLKDSLKKYEKLNVILDTMDIGLVLKSSSFEIDGTALEGKIRNFINSWPDLIDKEVEYLKQIKPQVIVSDIVPWAIGAAKQLNIKSILISNFTWVEIYQEYLSKDIIDAYQDCYKLVDEVLCYDLATPYMGEFFKEFKQVSLCARHFNDSEVQKIKEQFEKPIVFVSVGRSVELEEIIDVSHLDYQFIVTEGIQLTGDNVCYLPREVENTQDYIKASEMVITKAGFTTVAEVMLAKSKCGVIGRETVAEDRSTVKHLVNRGLAVQIEYSDGLNMEDILNQLKSFEPRYDLSLFTNDVNKITNYLLGHCLMTLSTVGSLVPLDGDNIPFEIKRVFYLVDVPQGVTRGKHAYAKSEQILICLHGSVKVKCTVAEKDVIYELNDPKMGLYLAPYVWREAYDFSEGAVLLAVSSEAFSEEDYRR